VGGVSERAGVKAGGSNPFAFERFLRFRNGERHPDLLEGATLRGVSSERGSRSVRLLGHGYPPRTESAPMTADVRRTPRRGTPSACATKHMHSTIRTCCGCYEDASFTRSFDPCTSILTTHHGASQGGGATVRHHGWASLRKWEEPTLGSERTDVARLAACHRFAIKCKAACRVEKRKEIEVSVPARI
jgi:hypothetical protein